MDVLTDAEVEALESICPGAKNAEIGQRIKDALERIIANEEKGLFQLTFEITEGSVTLQTVEVPFAIEILDVIIQARGASTSGTMKLSNGTNDITDAMVVAVDNTIVRAGTIDDAYSSIAAGGSLGVICAGTVVANTKGLVTILARRV